MKKYILGAVIAFGIFASPALTQAQATGLTTSQIQAVLSILSSFGVGQSTIDNVRTALNGSTSSTPTSTATCTNGATNYPTCNTCPSGKSMISNVCIATVTSCQTKWWFDSSHSTCSQAQFCDEYMRFGLYTFDSQSACQTALYASLTPTPTPACNNLWWFDSSHSTCSQKQFCGAYMYQGLQTFTSQSACQLALPTESPSSQPTAACDPKVCSDGSYPSWIGPGCVFAPCPTPTTSAPVITTTSLPNGTVGTSYSSAIAGTGGSSSYNWSITGLPSGLMSNYAMIDCVYGQSCINRLPISISGTPTTAGTYTVTVKLQSGTQTVSKQFSLVVASTNVVCPNGTTNYPYCTTCPSGMVMFPNSNTCEAIPVPVPTAKSVVPSCSNEFCSGSNSIVMGVSNSTDTSNTNKQNNNSLGPVCCDGSWWIDTRGSNWVSDCNGRGGGLQVGGWYGYYACTSQIPSNQTSSALDAFSGASSSSVASSNAWSYVWNRDLQIGSPYSADVNALQVALTKEGVYVGEITGGFYNQTFTAVRQFQQKYGIKESGYVGAITREKLNTLY